MVLELNERSVLFCKYLSSILLKYSRIMRALSSDITAESAPQQDKGFENQTCQGQQDQLKAIIYQVFYLFVGVLESLAEHQSNVSEGKGKNVRLIFEIMCKYLNDFLTLYRLVGFAESSMPCSTR